VIGVKRTRRVRKSYTTFVKKRTVPQSSPVRALIMGAAGRDFHNFNVFFRGNKAYEVVAFTATQIPGIEGRVYPRELAGPRYRKGIPILPENQLKDLIKKNRIQEVVFAYSDVSHEYVMHKASAALASGPDFRLMGTSTTMLNAKVPVVSVCAVRTGSGKSQTSRRVCNILRGLGYRVVAVRHPMPYGDLKEQICQRFSCVEDLEIYHCTVEEREEYEAHIVNGVVVYAGVDYERILREAEKEADIIVWDGGNNDMPFYVPDLHVVVADPYRPGHELTYYPGESNLRMADVVVMNKVNTADQKDIETVNGNIRAANPSAIIVKAASVITVDDPDSIRGKRVLVVEDGPTVTHGGMSYGAGTIAAKTYGAREIVDPRPHAVGSIVEAYRKYTHLGPVLPALGYGKAQIRELEETVKAISCDAVVVGTPIDLRNVITIDKPAVRARYELQELGSPNLEEILSKRFPAKQLTTT
jgi:predicted GTPase